MNEIHEQMSMSETSAEYEAFVEKFKPKLTTDDCYTPEIVYNAIRDYAVKRYRLQGAEIARPFWPGKNYKKAEYPEGCVVIDNPPFSIMSEIVNWYMDRGIRFFLFAPGLTLMGIGRGRKDVTRVCTFGAITYANGAVVNTSFVTNLSPGILAESAPELSEIIEKADKENTSKDKAKIPKYTYPDEVLTASMLNYMANHGVAYQVRAEDAAFIRELDAQREKSKTIFGAGFLLSEKAAAEKAAAEKAAAEKAAAEKAAAEKADAIVWELSEREREIIRNLGERSGKT